MLHLTNYRNYFECAEYIGKPISAEPELVEADVSVIVESGLWFWRKNDLKKYAEDSGITEEEAVRKITRAINGGHVGLAERMQYKKEISRIFVEMHGECL